MFVRLFTITLMAALFGTGVGAAYTTVYAKILTMDFSEGATLTQLLIYNIMFCFGTALIYFAISKAIKKREFGIIPNKFSCGRCSNCTGLLSTDIARSNIQE